ncbi:MAG: hypothetical protein AKCLJLPJ_02474 [Fimbriimonadales bacterium]|nr:hypothetical protein [Fimbriimonadales bacterium]
MRDLIEQSQFHPLRIEQHKTQVLRRVPEQEACDDGRQPDGLSAIRRPPDKKVRHLRKIGVDVVARDILAETHDCSALVVEEFFAGCDFAQTNDRTL